MADMTGAGTRNRARGALDEVERRQRQVAAEIGMPRWYWWGLALAWVGLAVVIDLGNAWATGVGTFLFGMVHAIVYGQLMGGRQRTRQLRVHTDIVGRHGSLVILAALVGLGALMTVAGTAASADGAEHPVTMAGVLSAVVILLGGPRLMTTVRERAARGLAR